jgi:hypothetical protein
MLSIFSPIFVFSFEVLEREVTSSSVDPVVIVVVVVETESASMCHSVA